MKKVSSWRILFCLILPLISTACGLLGLGGQGCDQGTLDSLRLELPSSASNIQESCVPGFAPGNAQYRATFSMSPVDLQTFQDSTAVSDWQTSADEAAVLDEEAASLDSLIFGHYGDGIILQEVLIDTSDAQQYRVQVFNAYVD